MRIAVLSIVLLRSFNCDDVPTGPVTLRADGGHPRFMDGGFERDEFSYCTGASLPPDAGTLCTSSWFCRGLSQSYCKPAYEPSCNDAGACALTSCSQAADCSCGSCVDQFCQPRPGLCTAR